MRLEVTLNLDPDMAGRLAAAVKSGEYGSSDEAVLMAALTMFLDRDTQLEEDRLLDEAELSGYLTEEEYQASMAEYWTQRRPRAGQV